jgi:hypothetical protein
MNNKPMLPLTLKVELNNGTLMIEAAMAMIELADKLNVCIESDWSRTPFLVFPSDSPSVVEERLQRRRLMDAKTAFGQTKPVAPAAEDWRVEAVKWLRNQAKVGELNEGPIWQIDLITRMAHSLEQEIKSP